MRERLAELRKEMETKPKMGTDVKATSRQAPRPRLLPTGNSATGWQELRKSPTARRQAGDESHQRRKCSTGNREPREGQIVEEESK